MTHPEPGIEQGPDDEQPMDGYARRRERSRADIREAARELFGQFGVDRVSVADIARKAGVSHGTIYNNFGSKDALAREFVTAAVEQLVGSARQVLECNTPFREKLAAFLGFISGTLAAGQPPGAARPAFTWSPELLEDDDIRRIRDDAKERMADLLLGVLREGKEEGVVQSDTSEEAYTIYFNVFMELFTDPQLQYRLVKNPNLPEELGSLMINGLTGPQTVPR